MRHFSDFAMGTIEDVLALVRELHGDIPVDAAPWLRNTLLRAIEPMADRMATDVFEVARKMNVNTSRDRYYPGAEVARCADASTLSWARQRTRLSCDNLHRRLVSRSDRRGRRCFSSPCQRRQRRCGAAALERIRVIRLLGLAGRSRDQIGGPFARQDR